LNKDSETLPMTDAGSEFQTDGGAVHRKERHGRVQSILGANVQPCCERYVVTMHTLLGNSFVGQTFDDICRRKLTSEHYWRAVAIVELRMIKRFVLDV